MGILANELSAFYSALLQGDIDPLSPLRVQYADYAVWQRKWIEGDVLQQQSEYWKTVLTGAPALLELPMDHPRPAQKDYAGASAGLFLDEKLTAGLKELSRRHGATLYMTLLTAWVVLLGRLSGQQDVVTGTPVANRSRGRDRRLNRFSSSTHWPCASTYPDRQQLRNCWHGFKAQAPHRPAEPGHTLRTGGRDPASCAQPRS